MHWNFFLRGTEVLLAGPVGLGTVLLDPHFPGRVLGFRVGRRCLAARGLALCPVHLAVAGGGGGAPCGELGLEYRNHGSLCLPAPSPQALCLGFSTCGCGLFVLVSWAWVYSGATGCSWGRDWITVTQSPGWEATPSSGVTCSALDTAGGCSGPGWAPRSQEHNMTHWAGLKGQGARRPLGGTPRWG